MLTDAPSTRDRAAAERSTSDRGLPRVVVVLAGLCGLGLRLVVLWTPLGRPDADEVLSALMARHLGDGYPAFVWGQQYGGTAELLPVAASLRVFGWSPLGLRVPNLVLAAVIAVLVWRLATRVLPALPAQLAGLLVWLGPAAAVWFGLREQLFYPPTVVFGLGTVLFAARARERGRWPDAVGLGLAAGLGWWTSPFLVYFVAPALAMLLLGGASREPSEQRGPLRTRPPHLARTIVLAAGAAAVGALPWLVANAGSGFASLGSAGAFTPTGTYAERFTYFFVEGLPGALGFRTVFTHAWIGGPVGVAGYFVVLAVLGVGLWRALRGRSWSWDGIGFALFPFLFAAVPFVKDDPNLRYLFFVVPFVGVLVARVATSRRAALLALAVTLVLSVLGLQRLYVVSEVDREVRVGNVGDLDQAIAALEREGIDRAYADYWIAYRVAFETEERIIAAPASPIDRYEPYTREVGQSDRSAWIVDDADQQRALLDRFTELGVEARVLPAGEHTVIVPSRPVAPDEVPDAATRPRSRTPAPAR